MADFDKEFLRLIERIGKKHQVKTVQVGQAVEVNNLTCTVKREGQPDLLGVRLNAIDDDLQTYVTVVPKENSSVLVAVIENQKKEAVVICCSEVEKYIGKFGDTTLEFKNGSIVLVCGGMKQEFKPGEVLFNDGTNGGIPIVGIIDDNLAKIKSYVQQLEQQTLIVTAAVDTLSGASGAMTTAFESAMAAENMDFDNMENDKVKH